ncbi:MAG: GTPase HflX [Brevinema sp.]
MSEKYFLASVVLPHEDAEIAQDSLNELAGLVSTAGGDVVGSTIQRRHTIDASTYIGSGKLEEIAFEFDFDENDTAAVVFNSDLSPAQVRNIEKILECRVITRTELILHIFAMHAQSRVAKLQVEMAQLSYMMPRLVGQGSEMSRMGGGAAGGLKSKGAGETKLETDKRKINDRIAFLRRELKKLETESSTRRKSRENIFKTAIAGYTNAGKSSLASRLVKENLLAENKLFSTLDTTTRRLSLGISVDAVLTDTVGFIRDIPHELVESFKSTLAESADADLLMHAIDLSSPFFREKKAMAEEIMKELGVDFSRIVLVFNKIDLVSPETVLATEQEFPNAFFVSAKDEYGIEKLRAFIKQRSIAFLEEKGALPEYLKYQ